MLALFNHESNILICSVPTEGQIDHVPAHVYTIGLSKAGIHLNKARKRFELPKRFYGDHEEHRNIIVEDYLATEGSTGVLLSGLKGSGKSLLGEDLANSVLNRDIPVIMVTEAFGPDLLRSIINIVGPCMLYFDEFGKIYNAEKRQELLTLFSDSSLKKVLIVITSNSEEELSEFMINRPGRFRYSISYRDIPSGTVQQMLAEYDLSEPVKEMLAAYVRKYCLSIDMFQQVLKTAAKAADLSALVKRMRILNVPAPLRRTMRIDEVYYKGERFYGDVLLNRSGDVLELEFYQKSNTDLLAACSIDFDQCKRLKVAENKGEETWRITVNDDLVVQLVRGWSEHDVREGQVKGRLVEKKKDDSEHRAMFPSLMGFGEHVPTPEA